MDLWKYFAIGHRDHVFCNPLSEAKFDEVVELLALPAAGRILDVGCGRAEFLVRAARRWSCEGVGVDLSPPFVVDARAKVAAAGLAERVEIVEKGGADYEAPPESFDAVLCLGATWIWGGYRGTLERLAEWTRPGGVVVVGEPFWRTEPSPEHMAAAGHRPQSFGTHESNVQTGLDLGLHLLHSIVSSEDDWDRYEGYQWAAAERYAREHPEDPDRDELLTTVRKYRDQYLRWGRAEFGWAVYLFLKP